MADAYEKVHNTLCVIANDLLAHLVPKGELRIIIRVVNALS